MTSPRRTKSSLSQFKIKPIESAMPSMPASAPASELIAPPDWPIPAACMMALPKMPLISIPESLPS